MKNILTLFCLLFLTQGALRSQEVKFGKIEKSDLQEGAHQTDSAAVATVLYRNVYLYYRYIQGSGFHQVREVHERIKIHDKDGYEYATVTEALYHADGEKEGIGSLKGNTYNLEGDKVSVDKLKRSDAFREELNDYYDLHKFTMPNVREGSIIEYEYTVQSPFAYSIDEIDMQYDIPIAYQKVRLEIPEFMVFTPRFKGYLLLRPETGKRNGKVNFTYSTSGRYDTGGPNYKNAGVDYEINTHTYEMREVPALDSEAYVNNMDNYRAAVNYELQYVQFPESPRENFNTSWDQVVQRIYQSDRFGYQLGRSAFFRKITEGLIDASMDDLQKIAVLFAAVQSHMSWNGNYGYHTEKGVKKAYEDRSGNVGDINLMLVAMLESADLNAKPVLISTRDHGIPMRPTQEGFNYVIAQVHLDQGYVLLDATSKLTKPNLLPVRALNWFGRSVAKDGSSSALQVFPAAPSKEIHYLNLELHEDGGVSGKLRSQFTEYRALAFRSQYGGMNEEEYLEKYENKRKGIEVHQYQRKNLRAIGKPVTEQLEFTLDDQLTVVGDQIFFNPLLLFGWSENPFKKESREYPVDFAYPWQEKFNLNIAIPQGYEIAEIPESTSMSLPDRLGSFSYQIGQQGRNLQVMVDLSINNAIVPATYYGGLKELFRNIVMKETEQVVLKKIGSDGHQEGSTGGR